MQKVSTEKRKNIDVQFLLANERTLLAWIRTSLTIQAGGIALTAFHKDEPLMGIVVLLLGVAVALIGHLRYRAADKSIRTGHLPPSGTTTALQLYGIVGIAIIIALAQIYIFQ